MCHPRQLSKSTFLGPYEPEKLDFEHLFRLFCSNFEFEHTITTSVCDVHVCTMKLIERKMKIEIEDDNLYSYHYFLFRLIFTYFLRKVMAKILKNLSVKIFRDDRLCTIIVIVTVTLFQFHGKLVMHDHFMLFLMLPHKEVNKAT